MLSRVPICAVVVCWLAGCDEASSSDPDQISEQICGLDVQEPPDHLPADPCRYGSIILGPERVERSAGPPQTRTFPLTLAGAGLRCLVIENGGHEDHRRIAAAWVSIPDAVRVGPERFNPNVTRVEEIFTSAPGDTLLSARVASAPGTYLDLTVRSQEGGERVGAVAGQHLELANLFADPPDGFPAATPFVLSAQGSVLRFPGLPGGKTFAVQRWFEVRDPATCEVVRVLDADTAGPLDTFSLLARWDGRDTEGGLVPAGLYFYRAVAQLVEVGEDERVVETLATPQQPLHLRRLLASVSIDDPTPCVGQPIHVTVETASPSPQSQPLNVSIAGRRGSERHLQFFGFPSARRIGVAAWAPGGGPSEVQSFEVLLTDCEDDPHHLVEVYARGNRFSPLTMDLGLQDPTVFPAGSASYLWSFGDGTTEVTDVPFVSHDYGPSIPPDVEQASFTAVLTITRHGEPDIVVPKTVDLWNLYALQRARGLIQPPLVGEPELEIGSGLPRIRFTLRNHESEPLVVTRLLVDYHSCNGLEDPQRVRDETTLASFPPGQDSTFVLDLPPLSPSVCDIAVHLLGRHSTPLGDAQIGASVYAPAQDSPQRTEAVADHRVLEYLEGLVARGLVDDPDVITEEDIYEVTHSGLAPPPPVPSPSTPAGSHCTQIPSRDLCRPGDPPPREGMACLPVVDEDHPDCFSLTRAHIANALRGHILLVGTCGGWSRASFGRWNRRSSTPTRA